MNLIPPTQAQGEDPPVASSGDTPENGGGTPVKSTLKKWIKKLPFFMEMDYFRRKIYDSPLFDFTVRPLADSLTDWPRYLLIDNTNRCNAKCVWCPNPDLTNLGLMKMPLFKKIIDDYATRGGRINFGTFGEPLMDSDFADKIEYIKQFPKIERVELLTNAFFLNEKIIPAIIENQVRVEISLDELDKETFEKVKKMSYDVVRENILAFLEANDRSPNPVPVNFRIKTLKTMEQTLNHEFFKLIDSHQCTIDLTPIDDNIISNWAGKFDTKKFFESFQLKKGGGKFNHKQYNLNNTAPCVQLWKWMVIYWDGSVVLCCADMFADSTVDSLQEKSIEEIWNGPNLRKRREQMTARKRFEIPICQNCDIHTGWQSLKRFFNKKGDFLPHFDFFN